MIGLWGLDPAQPVLGRIRRILRLDHPLLRPFARAIKMILPKSLLGRSLLIIVIPLILLQVITATIFFDRHWDTMSRRLNAAVGSEIGMVLDFMAAYPDPEEREWMFALAYGRQQLAMRFEPEATLPGTSPLAQDDDFVARTLYSSLAEHTDLPYQVDVIDDKTLEIRIAAPDGLLTVEVPRKRLFSVTTYIFIGWMTVSSVILFAVATVFMRNQVRPIGRLASAADALGKGRDVPNFRSEGALEVRRAALAFTRMRDRINRQIAQRTEMLAGVSHDLRTPLTRMRLQLALMEGEEGTVELTEDIAEMERMVEGYLAFARGEGTEETVATCITDLVDEVVGRMRRNGARIDLHTEQPLTVPLKPNAMERCLANIIGNAHRFGQHIAVRVGVRDGHVEVVVDDDGPGIPPERREDVFRAFFRIESSRNPRTGGTGLGLTIARDVVRAMGGDIFLENSPFGGLRARIRLPM
ncbi:ATP-binding protein [Rhodospirillum rubrum]|uniref:histidine kinase n=1 Tax=Rhodospirillum rubrum (strain ATCC 11170 / ATH 1.1.1 / DSM 467 / LMG 4362 / NCIMB 8255 / S1) TaxID=269796 RepID=Q2RS69_RHORT|nr:ATP-binding protein [Rhodospirillum rubrum]ABC23026.1 Periplasmic Sensor Signal Transduction Histidine Kinase [Rhodospirillum rubrum ATCC 11170]AEO48755.1 periplasmic sensor Signal transduction histidine kinase [Rhodospirillum rubrum F11]MBK5954654.1 HAMP domain-containing histidine kinase [Rhodospirillum rubrum]QXG79010.1 HAMP domain-containing protein [Rhodospirillum rubrum]HAQ01231.1 HAMP domain-containing histidine kinase [Rhodospirillum rubrum]